MVDVGKQSDKFLDAIGKYRDRRDMTLMQLDLNEYAYPELASVWDALRACLKGADDA